MAENCIMNNFPFQLVSWFRKAGEDNLNSLATKLKSAADILGVKQVADDFEKLDFIVWVSKNFIQTRNGC